MGSDLQQARQTPSHSRPQQLQSIPEGALTPGGQAAHLEQAACSERSAQRLSCPLSVTPQAQQAHASATRAVQHGKQLRSQHAAGAAPASAAQHLMSRPGARDRRGYLTPDSKQSAAGHEQSSPGYLIPVARPEARQISQHSSAAPPSQQSGASAATRCTSIGPGVAAQIPGVISRPQPRPVGTLGNQGRPAQVPSLPSGVQLRPDRQAPAPAVALHGQQQGPCGPPDAINHLSGSIASAASAPGYRPQGRPGQQTGHMQAGARHAGTRIEACRQPVTTPSQQSGVQISSMATPQRPPRLYEQQQHSSCPVKALAVQRQTAKQGSTAALATGPQQVVPQSSGVFGQALMGKLPISVMQAWVQRDLEAACAHLELTEEVRSHAVYLSLSSYCIGNF